MDTGAMHGNFRRLEMTTAATCEFQLCFRSLFQPGRGFAFPCDRGGKVDLDHMSERTRNNYFFARAMVGRDLSVPAVEGAGLH
jgi:hypothetical protein